MLYIYLLVWYVASKDTMSPNFQYFAFTTSIVLNIVANLLCPVYTRRRNLLYTFLYYHLCITASYVTIDIHFRILKSTIVPFTLSYKPFILLYSYILYMRFCCTNIHCSDFKDKKLWWVR